MTEYYYAKEREESAVERINDSYLEALNSLEKLEAENAELRHDLEEANNQAEEVCIENSKLREELADAPKCETCEAMLDCDECLRADGSHKERRRLKAENAKLREQIDAAHMSRLLTENENEKLRELAAKMAEALRVGGEWCDRECIVVFGCDGMDECPIAKELRELGVEVNDV